MSHKRVYILGGAQTDYSTNWHRGGKEISDILLSSFDQAIDETQIPITDIESIHVGNFVGALFCGQAQLGGIIIAAHPELAGIPTARHEAACASGSMAAFAGMREIEAEHYDLVAITGVEMMRNVDGQTASKHLGAAAHVGHEATMAMYPWVSLFSDIKEYYQERYGIQDEHLAAIAKVNYANAQRNPNAQSRNWELTEDYFTNNEKHNPIVEGILRKSDCGRVSDGSATILLASAQYAQAYANKHNIKLDDIPYVKGWGHRTAPITLGQKLESSYSTSLPFPHLKGAIDDAFRRSGINEVSELDAIETHDCFTISEYAAIEHFGITAPGEAWKAIENESITMTGNLPINPSGGLIGMGHPVGATGVRMLLDAYKQVSNKAGDYQVENSNNVGILNIGGSFTTVASFVIGI